MADSRIDSNRVWVTVTSTVSTGAYETARIELGYSKTYSSKEDPLDVIGEMSDDLEALVVDRIGILKKRVTKRKRRDEEES